jgi:hypothetical protein
MAGSAAEALCRTVQWMSSQERMDELSLFKSRVEMHALDLLNPSN